MLIILAFGIIKATLWNVLLSSWLGNLNFVAFNMFCPLKLIESIKMKLDKSPTLLEIQKMCKYQKSWRHCLALSSSSSLSPSSLFFTLSFFSFFSLSPSSLLSVSLSPLFFLSFSFRPLSPSLLYHSLLFLFISLSLSPSSLLSLSPSLLLSHSLLLSLYHSLSLFSVTLSLSPLSLSPFLFSSLSCCWEWNKLPQVLRYRCHHHLYNPVSWG